MRAARLGGRIACEIHVRYRLVIPVGPCMVEKLVVLIRQSLYTSLERERTETDVRDGFFTSEIISDDPNILYLLSTYCVYY
jgi:hypothetical protein